jgi:hypothetical protein
MEDFVAYPSRWRLALIVLGAAAFVINGLWAVGAFGPHPGSRRYSAEVVTAAGWFSIVFFGGCGAVIARRMFDKSEQLRIGGQGIRWARWSDVTNPWSEVVNVTTWKYRGQAAIVLHLRDPARFPGKSWLGRFAGLNRRLAGGDISISLTGTDRSFAEGLSAIERFRSRDV